VRPNQGTKEGLRNLQVIANGNPAESNRRSAARADSLLILAPFDVVCRHDCFLLSICGDQLRARILFRRQLWWTGNACASRCRLFLAHRFLTAC
jgi:hypothetical protein